MLLATNLITKAIYKQARSAGVKVFLFNEIDFIPAECGRSDEIFFNCTGHRVPSTWYTWEENERIIESFKKRFPQFFTIGGYDITLGIKKAMFWSNFKTGFLKHCVKEFYPTNKAFYIDKMHPASLYGVLMRYLNAKGHFTSNDSRDSHEKKYRHAIHIKNDFQLGLYQELIRSVESKSDFGVFAHHSVNGQFIDQLGLKNIIRLPKTLKKQFPTVNLLRLRKQDWYVLYIIMLHWDEFNEHIHTGVRIMHKDLKTLLINEGENGPYGAVVSEVLDKNKTTVYNTMNGIKSGEAQDSYINFHKWFVWDEEMKKLLIEKNRVPVEKLIVTGHLVEDLIRNYTYRESLDLDPETLRTKKVISLFSVKGKRIVKIETLKFLYNMLRENPDYYLLIRLHPMEKAEDYILPEPPLDNVHFVKYNVQNLNDTLHDQLMISDLSIVFGSTVSLDSKWMGVPCITFEKRESSLIYCVDGKNIIHVKTIEELEAAVLKAAVSNHKQINTKEKISDMILRELWSKDEVYIS